MDAPKRYHSVQLDKSRCKGCTNCLMHCPTEAIRVRDGRAHIIAERCIDCGECIRICDYHAKVAVTDKFDTIKAFRYAIALPAPSLYGQFRNLHPTPQMTSDKGFAGSMWGILFGSKERREPASALPVLKPDLHRLERAEDALVWFGHSSYLLQLDGVRLLVDPVLTDKWPMSLFFSPFKGTDVFSPEDMPDVDCLIVTHDHWDHLDYETVMQLKNRVDKVVCPLGVGEHFEYWGFEKSSLVELDWFEDTVLDKGFLLHCLPARHFSGRSLKANQALWASFLIETPSQKIYMGGDSGYDTHFAEIGKQYPGIDLAILENGQYNEDWKYIHTMPQYLGQVARDLNAEKILTVHHSKYALARHRWDEPLKNAMNLKEKDSLNVLMPIIGEVVRLK